MVIREKEKLIYDSSYSIQIRKKMIKDKMKRMMTGLKQIGKTL